MNQKFFVPYFIDYFKNIDKLDIIWYAVRNVGLIKKKLYEIVNIIKLMLNIFLSGGIFMTKTVKKHIAFWAAFAMVMAMLMYFPSRTLNIDYGLKASAEG